MYEALTIVGEKGEILQQGPLNLDQQINQPPPQEPITELREESRPSIEQMMNLVYLLEEEYDFLSPSEGTIVPTFSN